MKLHVFPLGLCLLLLSLPSLSAKTQEEVNNYLQQTVIPEFTVENMSASDALAKLQQLASLNQFGIFFDIQAKEKIRKSTVTLSLKNVPAYDVIVMICTLADVKFAIKRDQVRIFETGQNAGP